MSDPKYRYGSGKINAPCDRWHIIRLRELKEQCLYKGGLNLDSNKYRKVVDFDNEEAFAAEAQLGAHENAMIHERAVQNLKWQPSRGRSTAISSNEDGRSHGDQAEESTNVDKRTHSVPPSMPRSSIKRPDHPPRRKSVAWDSGLVEPPGDNAAWRRRRDEETRQRRDREEQDQRRDVRGDRDGDVGDGEEDEDNIDERTLRRSPRFDSRRCASD